MRNRRIEADTTRFRMYRTGLLLCRWEPVSNIVIFSIRFPENPNDKREFSMPMKVQTRIYMIAWK